MNLYQNLMFVFFHMVFFESKLPVSKKIPITLKSSVFVNVPLSIEPAEYQTGQGFVSKGLLL